MGLKSSKHYKRLSKIQHDYLLDISNAGSQTGHKVDPVCVEIHAKGKTGIWQIFKVDEYLTSQLIASFFSRETAKKKALKMSKLKPRKTNGLWKEKRSCKIFRRTSWIPYPSVIQSCTAITTSVIMPPTRTWTSSPSLSFKISVHPFSLTSPIFVLSCLFLYSHVSYIVYIIQVQKVIQKEF